MTLQDHFQQKLVYWLNLNNLIWVSDCFLFSFCALRQNIFVLCVLCFTIMICDKIGSFFASNLFSLIFSHIILIASNEFTGSIPMEIGLSTKLTSLGLSKWLFSFVLVCFDTKETRLFFASNLFSLIFSHIILIDYNHLTGSIPTEVGLLTELTGLWLSKRLFSFH